MDSVSPSGSLSLLAPLSGLIVPLERVPDPVFAQKLVGDGLSIDPTSQDLLAPCAGTVTQIHAAGHAVTVQTPGGVEIMMHIGLDTVHLKGDGFTSRVAVGAAVTAGQPLISFDADHLARRARSLLTQVIITTPDLVTALRPATGLVTAGRDPCLEVTLRAAGAAASAPEGGAAGPALTSEAVVIPNPTGLHARPAAVLVNLARRFKADVRLRRGDGVANAKSVVSIMGLDVRQGDKVHLVAHGPDAAAALALLLPRLREGLGDEAGVPAAEGKGRVPPPADGSATGRKPVADITADVLPPPAPAAVADPNLLVGVVASPGLAVGRTFRVRHAEIAVEERGEDPARERERLTTALNQARGQLAALHDRLLAGADAGKAAIFAAHQELLEDPDVLDLAESAIAKGCSAGFAWKKAIATQADRLAGLSNELLAARANDLRDVGRRVLQALTGTGDAPREIPAGTILLAEDLTPSDTATLDRTRVLGFATVGGGATSHVAILARSLDIPALAGVEPRVLEVPDGTPVILDAHQGRLRLHPTDPEMVQVRQRQEALQARKAADLQAAKAGATTTDGLEVQVVANIGGLADAQEAVRLGAEGVGLLRSEFLFLERVTPPTEDEQYESYRAMAVALGPERPLVIRTLDVGGDKPLAYLPIPPEANPFLGVRGLRVGLDRPDLLRTQLRAILRASVGHWVQVMFPMVASVAEWRAARDLLREETKKLGVSAVPAGIMVEVPAAAVLAERFAEEVDFFSIGTNDLTQYTLAMDRGHPKLAAQVDGLHPAVLHLIAVTAAAGKRRKRPVSVCGGLAGDPQAVPLLLGLGVDKLSVSVPAIPGIKALVRRLTLSTCRALAEQALTLSSPAQVRDLVSRTVGA
ncbi:MAG: phosphoenolpyruvate--protein phosphotransferase [Candidatus Riflebacteria bacterium]|nr:phosphoenolpyruvate--protein phosphotransferase [Candidatus Riflebacteria bacterium]